MIEGGEIKVTGNVQNEAQSTILFRSYNGILGKLETNSLQNNGTIQVDVFGLKEGNYSFITGTISGSSTIEILNGSNGFLQTSIQNGSLNVALDRNAISTFESSLSQNEANILKTLDSTLSNVWVSSKEELTQATRDIEDGIFTSYISTPLNLFQMLKGNKDYFSMQDNLQVGAFGGGLPKSNGSRGFGGVFLGKGFVLGNNMLSLNIDYGYASNSSKSSYQDSKLSGHILSISLLDRINFNNLEIDIGLYNSIGFFNLNRDIKGFDKNLISTNGFNIYSLNLDTIIGYRSRFDRFSIRPSIGLSQYLNTHNAFRESGDFTLNSDNTSIYMLDMVANIEARLDFAKSYLFASINAFVPLTNGYKDYKLNLGNYSLSKDNVDSIRFSSVFGGNISLKENMSLILSGFYMYLFQKSNAPGFNVAFGYRF